VVLFTLLAMARGASTIIARAQTPDWHSYTMDTFDGLVWRWRYNFFDHIYNFASFCPHCDIQVEPRHNHYLAQVVYYCDECNRPLARFDMSIEALHDKVGRLVEQKLRNGTWETAVR
jgi:hypothetical protein